MTPENFYLWLARLAREQKATDRKQVREAIHEWGPAYVQEWNARPLSPETSSEVERLLASLPQNKRNP